MSFWRRAAEGRDSVGRSQPVFAARQIGAVRYYSIPWFAPERGVTAAFSTRLGGRSRGVFATLNLGLHVGDDPEAVLANRARFCASLGLDPRHLVACAQVHGNEVAVVGALDRGRGAFDHASSVPGTDGLVTTTPGVPLITFYGDCVPLFLFDPVKRAIALVHAGWRGTLGRIAARALAVLQEHCGTAPATVLAAIGPAIGPCCYAIGADLAVRFAREFPGGALVRRGADGAWRLDLWTANRRILLEAGVKAGHIAVARRCTACAADEFFSHRSSGGKTGRMAAILMLDG